MNTPTREKGEIPTRENKGETKPGVNSFSTDSDNSSFSGLAQMGLGICVN